MVTYLKYVGAPTFCFRHAAKDNPRIDPAKCGTGHYTRWTAETLSLLLQPLQHGLDAGIDGDVRDAGAADDVGFALGVGEMQEAAEVVILVENVEERLDFGGTQLKGGEGDGLAEPARGGKVAIHNFAKAQHGRIEQVIMRIPQGRFAPWAEAQGLHSPVKAKHLVSELKLRPPSRSTPA